MTAFFKKEWMEWTRTYKALVLGIVFLLLGLMSPLAARYLPELMAGLVPEELSMNLPDPSVADAWAQFYKNVSQMGMIAVFILFSHLMGTELSRGTLIPVLTKGLPRRQVVLAKWAAALLLWLAVYGLCAAVSIGYTWYFWKDLGQSAWLGGVVGLWLFGAMCITWLLLGGVLFKSQSGSLMTGGLGLLILFVLNLLPVQSEWSPLLLASGSGGLLSATVTAVVTAVSLGAAILIFDRKML